MPSSQRIAVVGLGYVGLPLAVAFARRFPVTGFDIDAGRVDEIRAGLDRTGEVEADVLRGSPLQVTTEEGDLAGCDYFVITVPTPVDADNRPDLGAVVAASETVGRQLRRGAIVVLESTVYPGVTEEVCGPGIERLSGLKCGEDFFLGYSPERINPGDRVHTVERITKVVAGQTADVAERLKALYEAVTSGGVFVARDIRTAEAAKVIENAQRDVNIAFINEVTMIFQKLDVSVHDVLEAAGTKWNFLPFAPGLVGGHCIGVDPYYLAALARQVGYEPEVVLAGRRINDAMGGFIADCVAERLGASPRVLVLGLTFKENVPDLRNSKVVDIVRGLEARGSAVDVHDPLADAAEAENLYGIELQRDLDALAGYDGLVLAVAHDAYRDLSDERLARMLLSDGFVADVKGLWRDRSLPEGLRRWQL